MRRASRRVEGGDGTAWMALPFLIAVATHGIPLGQPLVESQALYGEELYRLTVERVSAVGNADSALPAVIRIFLYCFALLTVLRRRQLTSAVRQLKAQWPICALIVLVGCSVAWSPNTGKILANAAHIIGVTAIAVLAVYHYARRPAHVLASNLAAVLTLNLLAQLVVVFSMPAVGVAADGRWAGMAGHSNTLGFLAFLSTWAALAAALLTDGKWRLKLLQVLIGLVVLWGANSVTSAISCAIAVCSLMFILNAKKPGNNNLRHAIVLLLTATFLAALVIGAFSSADEVLAQFGRSSDFTGRTYLWTAAIDLVSERPAVGWGFDDNARVIQETGMPHNTYHNGFLNLAVRGGVVSAALLAVAFFIFLRSVRKARSRSWRAVSVSFFVACFIYNLTEVTFLEARGGSWLLLLFFLLLPRELIRVQAMQFVPIAAQPLLHEQGKLSTAE